MFRLIGSVFVAGVILLLACDGSALVISYDTGSRGATYANTSAYAFANRFTNVNAQVAKVTGVQVWHEPQTKGAIDVYLWMPNPSGGPGTAVAVKSNQSLDGANNTYITFDMSSYNIFIPPGTDLYAGLHPRDTGKKTAYDTATAGAGRSWYQVTSGGAWALGGPSSTTRNLMVRLVVTLQTPMAFTGYPTEYEYELDVNGDVTVTDTVPERDGVRTLPNDAYVATFAGVPYNVFVGTDGDDDLEGFGTPEDDTAGFNNEDLILGFDGNDTLRGLNGNDVLIGGAGTDRLYGDNGNDDLLGQGGSDRLYPGIGNDSSDGGDDNDLVVLADPGNALEEFYGGAGIGDKLLLASGYGSFGMMSCNEFESFVGGDGDDEVDWSDATVNVEMRGNAGDDILTGGTGNDILRGSIGHDELSGGEGNDRLYGENGSDDLYGENGSDALYTGTGYDMADGGDGDFDLIVVTSPVLNEVYLTGGAGIGDKLVLDGIYSTFNLPAGRGFEEFVGGMGDDTVDCSDATVPVILRGNGGNDHLTGGSANDLITGGEGDDNAFGGPGADILYGEVGIDHLCGGDGNDSLRGCGADFPVFSGSLQSSRYRVRDTGTYIVVTDTTGSDGMDIVRGCTLSQEQ